MCICIFYNSILINFVLKYHEFYYSSHFFNFRTLSNNILKKFSISQMAECWVDNAFNYFKQCYNNDFDQEYEFVKGREFCQVIGCGVYGETMSVRIK
jgi:hypothetical protein